MAKTVPAIITALGLAKLGVAAACFTVIPGLVPELSQICWSVAVLGVITTGLGVWLLVMSGE